MNMFIPLIQIQSNELFAGNTTTYQSLEKTGQNNKLQFYCDNWIIENTGQLLSISEVTYLHKWSWFN